MNEPLELEIGPRQGRGFAIHALGPDRFMGTETVPGPATPDNDMEIVTTEEAAPEPSAAPKAAGATISMSDSDEDNWQDWRPAKAGPATPDAARGASIPEPATPPATWQQPPMEPIAANATITEHTRGPTPRHGRSELKATPPWRESLSSRGFHLEAQGLTEENPTALDPPRDSAQLPLSLEGPEADLRSTVRRVAAQGASEHLGSDNRKGPPAAEPPDGIGTWVVDGSSVRGASSRAEPRHPQRPGRARTGDSQGPSDSPTATACAEIDNGGGDTHHPSSRRGDHGSTHGATNDDGTINGEFTGQSHNGHTASHGSTVRFYRDGQGSIIRFHRDGSTPPRVQSQARESIANPQRGKDPFVNALPESEKEEPNRYHIMLEEDVVGDTVRNRQAELQHHMQGHVPYMSDCEFCQRTRGTTPARKRSDLNPREFQLDQCFFRKFAFIVLVHTMSFAIAVCFRPEGESAATTAEHLHPWIRHFGVKQPHFMSDAEGLTKNIAARLADLCEGTEDSFAPERHAPAAERAIRTLKGIVATHELELREHGVVLDAECADVFDLLFQYAAHTHNRFSVSVGSTMTPMQKIRGDRMRPQITYPFGAVAYAKITRARRPDADAKYARGIYLGPVLGSTGHAMEIRLDSGETKRVIAPGLKLLYPLRFDANLLPGAKALDGFVPPPEAPKTKELFLPYVPGGGPPIDWVRQHGVTPKCPGCQEGVSSSRHSQKCVKRYQKWLRDSIDDALEALDEGPRVDRRPEELIGEDPYDDDEQMKPNKRTRFGGEEVRAFDPEQAGVGDLEIPEMSVPDADWNVSEYQPSEAEDEDMGDAPEHPQTFHEGVPVRYLEELLESAHYTPQPLSCCDHYDVEAACHLLVGRSSVRSSHMFA